MTSRRSRILVSVVGVLLVMLYAGLAAVQILVLNPIAAAPGLTLDDIRADMRSANESLGAEMVFLVLGIGVALAVAVAIIVIARSAPPRLAAMLFLSILTMGVPAYFVASFTAGMGLADTYGIGGGDHSPWSRVLYVASLASFVAVVTIAVQSARGGRQSPDIAPA
ncbi:hypothetical protein RAC69_04140 [Microbacterium sp. LS_15]|uniref:hypothetical protein n=1 Tax=Microbacterium sp. LS_15 TaxID=3055790 RepID=UPI0035C0365C